MARAKGLGGGLLLLLLLGALAAPLLTPRDPNESILLRDASGSILSPPYPPGTPGFPLGSDTLRRDQWSRLLYGARYTLLLEPAIALSLAVLAFTLLGEGFAAAANKAPFQRIPLPSAVFPQFHRSRSAALGCYASSIFASKEQAS